MSSSILLVDNESLWLFNSSKVLLDIKLLKLIELFLIINPSFLFDSVIL